MRPGIWVIGKLVFMWIQWSRLLICLSVLHCFVLHLVIECLFCLVLSTLKMFYDLTAVWWLLGKGRNLQVLIFIWCHIPATSQHNESNFCLKSNLIIFQKSLVTLHQILKCIKFPVPYRHYKASWFPMITHSIHVSHPKISKSVITHITA